MCTLALGLTLATEVWIGTLAVVLLLLLVRSAGRVLQRRQWEAESDARGWNRRLQRWQGGSEPE